ncbi:tripartite tricarboxylate transporter substrate binding protein [soil metagenome]
MLNSNRRIFLGQLAALSSIEALAARSAFAAVEYPSRPITIVVPFAAGTGVDVVARTIAERLAKKWGVAVTIDNRLGAGGTIGSEYVARAAADGYTLLFTGPPHYINEYLYKKINYAPVADFTPVVKISEAGLLLLVSKSVAANNIRELIAFAKAHPGDLTFGSGGNGSTPHLAGALFNTLAGTDIAHIPYKSGGQALTDTLGGQVSMTYCSVIQGLQPYKAGMAKALGVTGSKRSSAMPDVPTIAEAGVPDYDIVTWNGLFAPARTPADVVARLAAAVAEAARDPAAQEAIASTGMYMDVMGPQAFAAQALLESAKWKKVVASSGAKMD